MPDYKLINYKPIISYNDDKYIDLMGTTFNNDALYNPTPIIVNKYYVGRPDLISLAMYGTDKHADIICKINGISNPFELNEDDVILVPNIEYLNECIAKTRPASDMITDADNEQIQKPDKYNMQKRKTETRSPNEQTIGDSNYIIDKSLGLVFY